jgi:predicted tellurium resistance membrane protein TerC
MQLILVAAAAILGLPVSTPGSGSLRRVTLISRWTFGLAAISFGLVHLTNVAATARMIPGWMPLTPAFWTVFTGIAFALAGLAVLARVLDVLAARLLAMMLLLFNVLVLVRLPFASPHNHVAWGANAYNLAAAGAVWIFAESIAGWRSDPVFCRTLGSREV